jgi:uncharacterized protein YjbI with pentapeptide repeats/arsenate reductase-like glutaredoxin family protein
MPEISKREEALDDIIYFFGDPGKEGSQRRGFIISMLAGVYTSTFSEGGLKVSVSNVASTAVEAALSPRRAMMLPKLFKALKTYPDLIIDLVKMPGFLNFIEQLRTCEVTIKKEKSPLLEQIIANPDFFKDVITIANYPNPKEAISLLRKDRESLANFAPPDEVLQLANKETADLVIKLLEEASTLKELADNKLYEPYFVKIGDIIKDSIKLKELQKTLAELERTASGSNAAPELYYEIDKKNQEISELMNSISNSKKYIKRFIFENPGAFTAKLSDYSESINAALAPVEKLASVGKVVFEILSKAEDVVGEGDMVAAFLNQSLKMIDDGLKPNATEEEKSNMITIIELLEDTTRLKELLYTKLATDPSMIKNRNKFALSGVAFDDLINSFIETIKARPGRLQSIIEGQKLGTALSLSSVDNKDSEAKKLVLQKLSIWQKITSGISLATSSEAWTLRQTARGLKGVNTEENSLKTDLLRGAFSSHEEAFRDNLNLHGRLKYVLDKYSEDLKLIPGANGVLLELTALRSLERCDLYGLSFDNLTIDNFTIMHSKIVCSFKNAKIINTAFNNSVIDTNFKGATIKKCTFDGATISVETIASLSGATIDAESFKSLISAARKSNIEPIIIPDVKITGNLSGADLSGINFIRTNCKNVYSMEGANISNSIFSSDCSMSTAIYREFDRISRSRNSDSTMMKVILPHQPFGALLGADLSGLGAETEAAVRQALHSTRASSVLHHINRGINVNTSNGLENASSIILDDYLNSITANGHFDRDVFVQRTLCTRLATKIGEELFGEDGRLDEVIKLQTQLYEDLKAQKIDLKKLLDGSVESNQTIKTISDEIREKATKYTTLGLITGGIQLKIENSEAIKDIIVNHAPKQLVQQSPRHQTDEQSQKPARIHVTPQMEARHNSNSSFTVRITGEPPQSPRR